jgi:tRNA threonylcarbamoyladenosine biosynthesis protein TsaB
MAYILLIDTSGSTGTIAIAANNQVVAVQTTTDNRNQAATINTMIDQVLLLAGITLAQLNAVAVCGGPGSYTGLRIGMATAKGLCYVLDIPLIADNKLTLLVGKCQEEYKGKYQLYAAMLLARENEYFITAIHNAGNVLIAPQHILESNIALQPYDTAYLITDVSAEKIAVIGFDNFSCDFNAVINIDYWAIAANKAFLCNQFVNFSNIEPFYLKEVYTHK